MWLTAHASDSSSPPPSLQRGNQLVHREEALQSEKNMLLKQIAFRDEFIEVRVSLQYMYIHVCMYMYIHIHIHIHMYMYRALD